jgi:hypothetical protein
MMQAGINVKPSDQTSMASASTRAFAEKCARAHIGGKSMAEMSAFVTSSVADQAKRDMVMRLMKQSAKAIRAEAGPAEAGPAEAADGWLLQDEEEVSEESESESEESGDERDIEVGDAGDEDLFDISQFAEGKTLNSERAEDAYRVWMAQRKKKRTQLKCMVAFSNQTAPDDDISDGAFALAQLEGTRRLLLRERQRLADIEAALADPDNTPSENTKLELMLRASRNVIHEREEALGQG